MLSEVTQSLAQQAGGIFDTAGTDFFDILRTASTDNDGYGNEGASGDESAVYDFPIPGAIKASEGDARFVAGGEWTIYKIQIPCVYKHPQTDEMVEIVPRITDRIRKRQREGVNPEQIFTIKTIRPQYGVYYDILCEFNESEA